MGQGFALSGAAGAMGDELQEILKQKFVEQIQRQKLAEDARQADMQNQIAQGQLGLGQQRLRQDADQFGITSGFKGRELAMEEQAAPVRIAQMKAQTADIERKPQAEADDFARTMQLQGLRGGQELQQINRRGAVEAGLIAQRAAASGGSDGQNTVVQQGIGPDGKPVLLIVDKGTGQARPAQMPAGFEVNRPARPVTGADRQSLGYFNRMLQAEKDARSVEEALSGRDQTVTEVIPGFLANFLRTPEGQRYAQAQKAYTEARLRKESGAAIPPAEFENDRTMNFRVLGDKKDTITQKRRQRLETLRGLGNSAGRALQEYYGEDATLDALLKDFADQQGGGAVNKGRFQILGVK